MTKGLKFECIDSLIEGAITDPDSIVSGMPSMAEFIQKNAHYAKIIFNTDAEADSIEWGAITMTDETNLKRLGELTKDDVLLITQKRLTRGVDYRVKKNSDTKGIALLVMSASSSKRAYIQLLGRVGRYQEECRRYKWDQLEYGVDLNAQALLMNKLRNCVRSLEELAKQKRKRRTKKPLTQTAAGTATAKPTAAPLLIPAAPITPVRQAKLQF